MEKKFYTFLFATFFTAIQLYANVITVKGYVKRTNGSALANTEVKIAVYLASATTSCSEQTAITNGEGFYSKELSCTGDIRKSRISTKNCEGSILVQEKEVPVSKVVEASFTVCAPAPPVCAAKFNAEAAPVSSTVPALSEKFNSNISEAGNGDNIIHRTWEFHDGTSSLLDRVDPIHTFPHAGSYEVCLTIKTALGCESKVCKQIVVQPAVPVTCAAKFTFERLGPKKFRFNSTSSEKQSEDNIIERKWDFRDGSTSIDVSPAHEFPKPGNYEVCLAIKTAKGCESKFCSVVKAEEATAPTNNAPVQIVSLYPTPVHESLKAVVFSQHGNVPATITIVDAQAIAHFSIQITLTEGYNPVTIPVNRLTVGSYFIKVATQYGVVSKAFYKL